MTVKPEAVVSTPPDWTNPEKLLLSNVWSCEPTEFPLSWTMSLRSWLTWADWIIVPGVKVIKLFYFVSMSI